MATRSHKHLGKLRNKDLGSALWKHCHQLHSGNPHDDWKMSVVARYRDPVS